MRTDHESSNTVLSLPGLHIGRPVARSGAVGTSHGVVEEGLGCLEREPPLGVFLFAKSFFEAGRHLQKTCGEGGLRLSFNAPIYHLYSHALELTMKAFLRTKGVSAKRLASREFGHQLEVLWEKCVGEGLAMNSDPDTAFVAEVIEILAPFMLKFDFRYLTVGAKTLPALREVERATAMLMTVVKPLLPPPIKAPDTSSLP